jgi:hypothetical protein
LAWQLGPSTSSRLRWRRRRSATDCTAPTACVAAVDAAFCPRTTPRRVRRRSASVGCRVHYPKGRAPGAAAYGSSRVAADTQRRRRSMSSSLRMLSEWRPRPHSRHRPRRSGGTAVIWAANFVINDAGSAKRCCAVRLQTAHVIFGSRPRPSRTNS